MKEFFKILNTVWFTKEKRMQEKLLLDKDISVSNRHIKTIVVKELSQYLGYLAKQYNKAG